MIDSILNLPWRNVGKSLIVATAAVAGWRLTMTVAALLREARDEAKPKPGPDQKPAQDPQVAELSAKLAESQALLEALLVREKAKMTEAAETTSRVADEALEIAATAKTAAKTGETLSRNADLEAARAARLAAEANKAMGVGQPVGAGEESNEELAHPVGSVG